jgi:hypothetical protein
MALTVAEDSEFDGWMVVGECFHQAGGDRQRTAELLEAKARRDPQLMAALTTPKLSECVWEWVRGYERRFKAFAIMPDGATTDQARLEAGNRLSEIFFWTLVTGKPIGTASHEDRQEHIRRCKALEAGNRASWLWVAKIDRRCGKQVARDVLTAEQMHDLREQADREAAERV